MVLNDLQRLFDQDKDMIVFDVFYPLARDALHAINGVYRIIGNKVKIKREFLRRRVPVPRAVFVGGFFALSHRRGAPLRLVRPKRVHRWRKRTKTIIDVGSKG